MMIEGIFRKGLVVGIIILFIGTCINPLGTSEQIHGKNIITVDDEPGDGDYTSIKEALQHAQPDDTIQVYSGTYHEQDIMIWQRGLTLQGVPHELGSGNDTGKPVVTSSTDNLNLNIFNIFYAEGDDVTITGFVIIDSSPPPVMTLPIHIWGDSCTFSYNNVTGGWLTLCIGEYIDYPNHCSLNTRIIGNTIEHTTIGILYDGKYGNISGNSFRWLTYRAIEVYDQSTSNDISYNSIRNCSTGILYNNGSDSIISHNLISASTGIDLGVDGAKNITIMKNEFQRCGTGIRLSIIKSLVQIRQNNFINNTHDIRFVQSLTLKYNLFFHRIFDGNYYDTWQGSGPKPIRGIMVIFVIPIWMGEFFFYIPICIPWMYRDWHPAKEPYDIP